MGKFAKEVNNTGDLQLKKAGLSSKGSILNAPV
jgi:hypothetical protein